MLSRRSSTKSLVSSRNLFYIPHVNIIMATLMNGNRKRSRIRKFFGSAIWMYIALLSAAVMMTLGYMKRLTDFKNKRRRPPY